MAAADPASVVTSTRKKRRRSSNVFHQYPGDDIPKDQVLLWRPSAQEGAEGGGMQDYYYSCQYPRCHQTYRSRSSALNHGRTAHPPLHQAMCRTGPGPLSAEGMKERQKEKHCERSARYYEVRRELD